ncbi:MAG: ATP-dependent DNA helicase RecG [candidate division Zixibacteria bacterium RBG-1]|nr:MAG: ATP-dependent DNA helicase RecG [candidate division Zixibacteria bacterium RBG-1]OGC84790.1 MAG: ATP-dependent DNA helicase RecG [candidate division Zixibacteria bacterium RBG_19FT_COMBO_42_43]
MPKSQIESPVQYLKGIGPKKAEVLNSVGIKTIEDILYYLPRKYLDRSTFTPINQLQPNTQATVIGKVEALGIKKGRKNRFQVILKDKTGYLNLIWFANLKYVQNAFEAEDVVIASGEISFYNGLQMAHPEFEIISGNGDELIHTGRVIPVYPSTARLRKLNLDSRGFRRILKPFLERVEQVVEETLPQPIVSEQHLLPLSWALKNIHFPENLSVAEQARQRLAFDELFYLELMLALRKKRLTDSPEGIPFQKPGSLIKQLLNKLLFKLTEAQRKVLREIAHDMMSKKPMNRLLQGDVGSGKTVVALISMMMAVESGYQAAFMAPTEILAEQHYLTIHKLAEELGIKIVLLTSSVPKKEKDAILGQISLGEASIVIGTQALIQEKVKFYRVGLAVIDEQHRFGVMQRALLKQKGHQPDVLIMTATPIPRTLALTAYGDLDVSVIDQLPPGRKPIETILRDEKTRPEVYRFLDKKISSGRQVYIVYPLIEETEKLDLKAATEGYEKLKKEVFPNRRVGLIHGRIKNTDREAIMQKFRKGEFDILVSTTVIEVGVDVPNSSIMVIEHAERFGLSQLHQLRGRVGRGAEQSFCFLMANYPLSLDAKERLQALCSTTDGFKIAELDLKLRGPGEFFGTKQHGLPELKVADLIRDLKLLYEARRWAFKIIEEDPFLLKAENQLLRTHFLRRYKDKFGLGNIG